MSRISLLTLLATLFAAGSASAGPLHDAMKQDGTKTFTRESHGTTKTITVTREGNRTDITIVRQPSGGAETSGRGSK